VARKSPTVRERRLARALRQFREGAGLTIEEVAEKLEMSASTVSRMETAQVGVRPRDLGFLLDMYKVSEAERGQLLQIARERRQQRWWQEYADLPSISLAGLEVDASTIWQYSTQLVPGLLQIEAYARAVLEAIRLDDKPGDIDRRLELRLHRQALLTGEDAPEYWVVLDEAVVRRQVGGPAVMAQQLERLAEAATLSNVTLQVLPFAAGEHAGMDGDFTVLHYRESADPDVVFIENTGSDMYLEAPAVTRRYNKIFDHLRAAAQNPGESIRTLGSIQSQLDRPERS
jgi:transcriptional regulator with XRE-family HTH domain